MTHAGICICCCGLAALGPWIAAFGLRQAHGIGGVGGAPSFVAAFVRSTTTSYRCISYPKTYGKPFSPQAARPKVSMAGSKPQAAPKEPPAIKPKAWGQGDNH